MKLSTNRLVYVYSYKCVHAIFIQSIESDVFTDMEWFPKYVKWEKQDAE